MTADVRNRKAAAMAGLLAVALALGWQALVVHYTFAGNWTAWFCTGGNLRQPPLAVAEKIYVFPASGGYDGQFYHYIAHDPWFRRGLDRYIDAPRLRYRRILVPGLAYLAAVGQDGAIDGTLIAVNLLFLFAGVYWSSRYAAHWEYHSAWGLLFLLVPAVLVSLDRFVVDLALTALTVGFVVYVTEENPWATFIVLVLAPLARETGVVLIPAYCAGLLLQRQFRRSVLFATSLLPALAWYLFVWVHTGPDETKNWFVWAPLVSMLTRMTHLSAYPFVLAVKVAALALDECALSGAMLAFFLAFYRPPQKTPVPAILAAGIMAAAGIVLGPPVWSDTYAFGRVLSPLLVLLALQACTARSWVRALPLALIDPRIGLALAYKLYQVAIAVGR